MKGKGRRKGKGRWGETTLCTRGLLSGWSKLTVTTSARSLGKNFLLSTGLGQSRRRLRRRRRRRARVSRGAERIFNRIAILSRNAFALVLRVTRTPRRPFSRPLSGRSVVRFPPEYAIPIPADRNVNDPKMHTHITYREIQ